MPVPSWCPYSDHDGMIDVPEGNGLGLSLNKDIFKRKDVVIRKSS